MMLTVGAAAGREVRFHSIVLEKDGIARAWYAECNPHVVDLFVPEIEADIEPAISTDAAIRR